MKRGECMIEGCKNSCVSRFTGQTGFICEPHWRMLPMNLRVRMWDRTNYGKVDPTEEVETFVREAIRDRSAGNQRGDIPAA